MRRSDWEEAMHHSRLSTIVIDCDVPDLAASARFWSQALGKPIVSIANDGDGKYAELRTGPDEHIILLHSVEHVSRCQRD